MLALKCKCGHARADHRFGNYWPGDAYECLICDCRKDRAPDLEPDHFEATVDYSFTGLTEAQQAYLRAQLRDPWPGKNILLPKGVTMMQAAQFMHTLYRDDHFKTVLQ